MKWLVVEGCDCVKMCNMCPLLLASHIDQPHYEWWEQSMPSLQRGHRWHKVKSHSLK